MRVLHCPTCTCTASLTIKRLQPRCPGCGKSPAFKTVRSFACDKGGCDVEDAQIPCCYTHAEWDELLAIQGWEEGWYGCGSDKHYRIAGRETHDCHEQLLKRERRE